jgi:predicted Zn-dependent protease
MTGDQALNAWANPSNNTITVPEMMIRFLENDEGELAFVISHEIGHLQDRTCPQLAAQMRITAEGRSRFCEARADEIGVQYLVGAGYNPFDAAAFFGRLMMFQGDTGLLSNLVNRFLFDHPLNVERIGDLRRTLQAFCAQDPRYCGSH